MPHSEISWELWRETGNSPTTRGSLLEMHGRMKFIGPWLEHFDFMRMAIESPLRFFQHWILDSTIDNLADCVPAISVSAKPLGERQAVQQVDIGISLSTYDLAEVTVNFGPPSIDAPTIILSDPGGRGRGDAISERVAPTVEFRTLPHEEFEWEDGTALTEKEAPGQAIHSLDYVFTRHDIIEVSPLIFQSMDTVNSTIVKPVGTSLAGWEFPPESLRYRGAVLTRSRKFDGSITRQNVAMKFGLRNVITNPDAVNLGQPPIFAGWNHFYRADTNTWQRIKATGGGIRNLFPLVELNNL